MRDDLGQRSVWHQQGRRWRALAPYWLTFTAIFLISTLFIEDLHWGARVSALCNFIAGLCIMWTARAGSSADHEGIEVTQLRTRRLPWAAVEMLRTDAHNLWAGLPPVWLTLGVWVSQAAGAVV